MQSSKNREGRRQHREKELKEFFEPPVQSSRYRVEKVIGEGAYGVVVSAIDKLTGDRVAVKRIKRVLHSAGMATRILRELKFLRLLNAHENIVSVKDVLIPSHRDGFDDVFVVMELMPTDLGRLLRSKTVLHDQHVKLLMFQVLRGVNYLHQARVFHRDLNPANILVNSQSQLRICDFGLARVEFHRGDDLLFWTDYVQTRWYRAPELILAHSTKYSTAIDMWSVGCIFAETLSGGRPLFPGRNAHEQLSLILNVTGKPSQAVINRIDDLRLAEYLKTLPNVQPTNLSTIFSNASSFALELLGRLLAFDPNERITAADALALPYFDDLRHLGLGATTEPLDERLFAFERARLSAEEMRREFLREIVAYHPEAEAELLGRPQQGADARHRHGHYLVPSEADQFRQDMDDSERTPNTRKNRTLSTDVFAEINPENDTNGNEIDYKKGSTLGEAELSKIGGAPDTHASSFATHSQHFSRADGSVAMED